MPRDGRARAVDAPRDINAARKHLASARIDGVDPESRYGMLYDSGRKACDAILRASGRRLTHGTGHHAAYIAEARRLLGDEHRSVLARMEVARQIRNTVQYDFREVTEIEIDDVQHAVGEVLDLARAFVADLPDPG